MKSNLVIIGFVNSQNSAVGEILADKLDMYYLNTDAYIEYEMAMSILGIVQNFDEAYYYSLEADKLRRLKDFDDAVIATSATCIMNYKNMLSLMQVGIIIGLKSSEQNELTNYKLSINNESIYLKYDLLENISIMETNFNKLCKIADIVIDIDGLNNLEIADKIIKKLEELYQ